MNKSTPNRLSTLRKAKGWSQQTLAEKVRAHWITISKLERGKLPLTFEWAQRLSTALSVSAAELYPVEDTATLANIEGGVGSSGAVLRSVKYDPMNFDVTIGSTSTSANLEWLYVDTQELYPWLSVGDLICVDHNAALNDGEADGRLMGRLCWARIEDVEGQADQYICVPDRSQFEGRYNLNLLSGPPLRDVVLKSLSPVKLIAYRPRELEANYDDELRIALVPLA